MKKLWKVLIGLLIAGVGVIAAINALGIADINLFFNGWWTLLIIIPCTINLFTKPNKTGYLIGIVFGIILLLSVREVIEFEIIVKLAIPILIIFIGLRIAFGDAFGKDVKDKIKSSEGEIEKYSAILNSNRVDLSGQLFKGATLTSVLGSLDLDIAGSVIENDCVIRVTSVLASVKINVPEGINVKMSSNTVFGNAENSKTSSYPSAPTVYVKCICVFGGIGLR